MTDYQDALVLENLDLVNWVIRTRISIPNRPLLTYDDFYAIGCEAICRAALKYQPDMGAFAPFACRYIYNAIVDHCRAMNYRLERSVEISEDENASLLDMLTCTSVDFDETVTDATAMSALAACKEKYNGVARKGVEAIEMKLKGYEATEIAKHYDTSVNNVNAWISRARSKLRNEPAFIGNPVLSCCSSSRIFVRKNRMAEEESIMMTFYAAAGSYQIRNEDGKDMPYIMRLGKLQPVSIPEFSIWSMLLWDVLTHDELRKKYFEKMEEVKLDPSGFEKALEMLVKRKLIIKGVGYTGADALYNMLYDTYVIPLRGVQGTRRLLNIAKLLKQGKVNFFEAVYLLQPDKGTEAEQRIMKLVTQTPLSVPELVRCFENDVRDVSSADKVISAIYTEESDNQARLNNACSLSNHRQDVLEATTNLYLTRQVILEHA